MTKDLAAKIKRIEELKIEHEATEEQNKKLAESYKAKLKELEKQQLAILNSANSQNDLAGQLTIENAKIKSENDALTKQVTESKESLIKLQAECDHLVTHYEKD